MVVDYSISREDIITSLKGKTVSIPDLHALFADWPYAVSPDIERLRNDMNVFIEDTVPLGYRMKRTKAIDAAGLAAGWWPYAPYDELKTCTMIMLWLFIYDDETDSQEFSNLAGDWDAANEYREETCAYIRAKLMGDPLTAPEISSNRIIASIGPALDYVRKSYTPAQAAIVLHELESFLNATDIEQEFQSKGLIPSVDMYFKNRMGTSAVDICTAGYEACLGLDLPSTIMNSSEMRTLWHETNMIISVVNDLLSIKKEIAQNQVDSLVPLLYIRHGCIDLAINEAVGMVRSSIQSLEQASESLLARPDLTTQDREDISSYTLACKYSCTANFKWSLVSGRYRLGDVPALDPIRIEL